jgi:hypothetical protein
MVDWLDDRKMVISRKCTLDPADAVCDDSLLIASNGSMLAEHLSTLIAPVKAGYGRRRTGNGIGYKLIVLCH